MRYFSLLIYNFTAQRPHSFVYKPLNMREELFLALLDLSAALDIIDHQKLLNLLNQSFGIRCVALRWFESYIKDQRQTVLIGSCTSTPITLKYRVPQDSVLAPVLCTMYTTPLVNIIRKHGLNFHLYVDDTQLYIYFQPGVSVSKKTAIS